ncbi:AAA family ATPase [Bythopirellula goksoeyrii]|uniref:ATP-dependent zinc metalloprotease FtsH n=1 Tax=Bythopirellula goksoeyrii TaxID=1400387 RepID=A0A5B9QFU3_9BACT|nr:ATP-binding protein [Bythopirellula goksoeyrii]QEG37704.1 ATP-dependent zinc metalloprotease FtsH [Bythopirellula goksoeyrii]
MATGEQVKALVRSFSAGDGEHFVSVAMQIASQAARTGKEKLAKDLRDLVDEIKKQQSSGTLTRPVPIARPSGELAGLLTVSYPKTLLSEMVLSEEVEPRLKRVLREYRHQNRLREHSLSARRKLLLVGPPGCGKTMTASALAGELKLPLFSVQLHGLITKFMGETAAKLHVIFESMHETRGVYLFDEFDAIGSNRGAKNDVGEIRRVLNSFLQFLEQDDSDSLVVAATNYVEMLDDALFRRFDDVIEYVIPTPEQVKALIENRLSSFGLGRIAWTKVKDVSAGLSHAEISRACDDAAKDCLLAGKSKVTTQLLVQAFSERSRGGTIRL